MRNLQGFSDAATPVFSDLDRATPALTEATRNLAPFTAASTVALKSLGNAGEASGPKFAAADPVVKKARDLARSGVTPTSQLAKFLVSTEEDEGLRQPRRPDLQRHRGDQRVRQVRPPDPQPGDAPGLRGIPDRAEERLQSHVLQRRRSLRLRQRRGLRADPGRNGRAQRRHRGDDGSGPAPSSTPPRRPNRRLNSAKEKPSASAPPKKAKKKPAKKPKRSLPGAAPRGGGPTAPQRALLDYLLGP